jgi:hypothetical protein
MKKICIAFISSLLIFGCKDLNAPDKVNPDRATVLAAGSDLLAVLSGGYVSWWQGVHGDHPAIALGVAADAYTMSWSNFGAFRLGEEPRKFYNNRATEEEDYRRLAEAPWFGCLSAASSANDVFHALAQGVSIDNGGQQDQSIRAAAHLLRGLSWGYLGLIFDQAILADENADLQQPLSFQPYPEVVEAAVAELERAISLAQGIGSDFLHTYFNGVRLTLEQFTQLCHAYAARFLAQWPRTAAENEQVKWNRVLEHAERGLRFNFAPLADGANWQSYHKYVFAETGQGPFWVRLDQRLVAAFDPRQPARYPETARKGEPPLTNTRANSNDQRLESDFIYLPQNNFPIDRGEYFFSHYKHNRNRSDPSFAGDGASAGPMPAFLAADVDLLRAEALFRLHRDAEAITAINTGTRTTRGRLPSLSAGSASREEILKAIFYERYLELLGAGPMGQWFDRRRVGPRIDNQALDTLGGLQTGTPAQLPVPAGELRVQGLEPYNFGGPLDPEGIKPFF